MTDQLQEVMKLRHDHLEKFAAAFLREVGSTRASLFTLVEERSADGLKTIWYFIPTSRNNAV